MKNRSGRYKWLFHFSILMTAWSMALMNSSTVFAWGDSGGGRQSHTVDEINKNVLGEAIIFNTISNGEQVGGYGGDEKNFVSAKKSSEDPKGIWQGNEILIEDGEYYTIRLYAHNNNPNGYDSVAEDTHACFSVPQESEEEIRTYLQKVLKKEAFDGSGLIYGMGHAVYTLSDPREVVLKDYARKLAAAKGMEAEFELYDKVEQIAADLISHRSHVMKPVCANVDFYSGLIYTMLGIPEELFTPLFAISRISGWSAHRLEELVNKGKIIRPAYKYVGHHFDS